LNNPRIDLKRPAFLIELRESQEYFRDCHTVTPVLVARVAVVARGKICTDGGVSEMGVDRKLSEKD